MENKLKFSFSIRGTLEKVASCPTGVYYVDVENKIYFFEPAKGLDAKAARFTAMTMAALAAAADVKGAQFIEAIYEKCNAIKDKYVVKDGDTYKYDATLNGELSELVRTKYGSLYGCKEEKVFYFKSNHPGFLRDIEKDKFLEGIQRDLKSDDEETRIGATLVTEIFDDWCELDPDDIVEE